MLFWKYIATSFSVGYTVSKHYIKTFNFSSRYPHTLITRMKFSVRLILKRCLPKGWPSPWSSSTPHDFECNLLEKKIQGYIKIIQVETTSISWLQTDVEKLSLNLRHWIILTHSHIIYKIVAKRKFVHKVAARLLVLHSRISVGPNPSYSKNRKYIIRILLYWLQVLNKTVMGKLVFWNQRNSTTVKSRNKKNIHLWRSC